ncbi:MAG: 3-demethylubiquinone-9 3-methyltransferase [Methylibium sp. NZG]|nr:MAG: 3-demethylubiquinone-9 3-methyltransferase [Methylibium sp. NZG]
MNTRPRITTSLWFDDNAEAAMNHYVSIFKNSRVLSVKRYEGAGPDVVSHVLVCTFELDGSEFVAFNGGPMFKFNEAISLTVNCDSQAEVDEMWARLCEGGTPSQCGWLKDKFGVSWQVTPRVLVELLDQADPVKSRRVMSAMLQMGKLDIAALRAASDGGG